MPTGKVFFSYSRVDGAFALKLAEDLRKAGRDVWIDQVDIRPSEPWDEEIEKALEVSGCLLVILSQTSVASDNVLNEINYALEAKKQVLPVLIETNLKKPFNIHRLQHIDFTGSYENGLTRLVKALNQGKPLPAAINISAPGKPMRMLIVAGIVVIAAALITIGLFRHSPTSGKQTENTASTVTPVEDQSPGANGKWITETITNPFDRNDTYTLSFDFEMMGNVLTGTMSQVSVGNNRHYNIQKGILEGKIKDSTISFQTTEQSFVGTETVSFRNFYQGTLVKEEIRFSLQSDRPWGFPGQQFVAKRIVQEKAGK